MGSFFRGGKSFEKTKEIYTDKAHGKDLTL